MATTTMTMQQATETTSFLYYSTAAGSFNTSAALDANATELPPPPPGLPYPSNTLLTSVVPVVLSVVCVVGLVGNFIVLYVMNRKVRAVRLTFFRLLFSLTFVRTPTTLSALAPIPNPHLRDSCHPTSFSFPLFVCFRADAGHFCEVKIREGA